MTCAPRGFILGIATNDSEASARAQAAVMRIETHLDFIAGYDSGHGSKPDPGMVSAFAAMHGLTIGRVALVGDSLHDLHAARAAGACAIAVLSGPLGKAARTELAPLADHVLGSIAELPDLLDQLAAKAAPVRQTHLVGRADPFRAGDVELADRDPLRGLHIESMGYLGERRITP